MERSIAVTWNNPTNFPPNAEYQASLNTGVTSSWGRVTEHTFTGLVPGTSYTVNVTTRVPRNPNHTDFGSVYATATSDPVTVYTKPAVPGALTAQLYPGPNVTLMFTSSEGHVDKYEVTLNADTKRFDSKGDGVTQSVTFSDLTLGAFYNVSIVAVITPPSSEVMSITFHDRFRVKANSSGEVASLNASNTGSRWVEASWRKPLRPNGDMTGYVVVALVSTTEDCASAITFNCTDCPTNTSAQNMTLAELRCSTTNVQYTTKQDLNNPAKPFTGNLTGLVPYANYTVKVFPYNKEGEGTVADIRATTKEEPAKPLKKLVLTASARYQLNVMWTPGEKTGPTNYNVSWSQRESLQRDNFIPKGSVIVTGYSTTSYVIEGLLSFWEYEVDVFPFTRVDPPASSTTMKHLTLPTEPGPVTEPNITQPDGTATRLTLSVNCPDEQKRNGKIRYISYNSTIVKTGVRTEQTGPSGDILVDGSCGERVTGDIQVVAESIYNFSIFAKSESGYDGEITNIVNVRVNPRAPNLKPKVESLIRKGVVEQTTVAVEVCKCLVDTEEGLIQTAGIIVCVVSPTERCEEGSMRTKDYYDDPNEVYTWKTFKENQYQGKYRATPTDWQEILSGGTRRRRRSLLKRVARAADDFVKYTIGDNDTCEQANQNEFCNGPLPADREIKIFVFACTRGGCSEVLALEDLRTQAFADGVDTAAIVGGIVAALAVIALVVVAVFMYRRYRPNDGDGGHSRLEPHAPRVIRASRRTVNLEDTLHSRKSVSMILFPARVEVLHRNSNQYFLQEFQELLNKEKTFGYTSDVGKLDVNRVKNRYQHLLPYDNTRVKLYSRGDHGQDYINASYVKGARSPCDYLATQGPMVSTIPDFWKMVWEQRSPVIVMLSDLTENGQPKVDEYWPSSLNSVVQYGDVRVKLVSVSTLPHYTVRKIKLLVDKEQERVVTHYHLSGWTDQGSNLSLDDIADIVYIVTEETASSGPVTVHCSEGTMRTCSFIALHSLQRHVTQHAVGEEMDVFTVLLDIVKCRPHMMQSERQYMLIHDVVRVMVERKMRDDQGRRAVYQNAGCRDSALYDSTYAYIPDGHVYDEIGARKKHQTSEL